MKRIGILGGTFDPIHLGHAELAKNVKKDMALDELIFVPAKLPPHKAETASSAEDRYHMAVLTAETLGAGFSVSDVELQRKGLSYTWLTLSYFRKNNPNAALFFICGNDIFMSIETWNRGLELFNLANFIVADRENNGFDDFSKLHADIRGRLILPAAYNDEKAGKVIMYSPPVIDISSTAVRQTITIGAEPKLLLSSVYDYILKNMIYKRER